MRFVLSVLTVLWVASATPSPLPAQVHAEPRTAPELEERFRYELRHRPKLAQIGRIQVDNSQHQTLMS